ncbi:hypothetical protein [Lacipirellula sp.]|uniref:hypothetical protein n=1 Tax=Lacipirellula sp. TaxID=2691419 RepID=UPI003D12594E
MKSAYPLQMARGEFDVWVSKLRDMRAKNVSLVGASDGTPGEVETVSKEDAIDVFLKRHPKHGELRQQLIAGARGPYSLSKELWKHARDAA